MKEQSKILKLIAKIMKINNSNLEYKISVNYSGAFDTEIFSLYVYNKNNEVSFYKGYMVNSKDEYDLNKKRLIINEIKRLERLI